MAPPALEEPLRDLSHETREMHRAISSLVEELEAVDVYGQRVDATRDPSLGRALAHNRDEEKEHACLALEWIRRRDPVFDRMLRRFLFTAAPIARLAHDAPSDDAPPADGSLGIGSLRISLAASTGSGGGEARAAAGSTSTTGATPAARTGEST